MDIATGAVAIAGLKFVAQPAASVIADFTKAIIGPVGGEIGRELLEWYQLRRSRAQDVLLGAARAVGESGRQPHPVPGRVLLPLLNKASLEDDPGLCRRWISLLARAAVEPDSVHPSFVAILSELSPFDAQALEDIFARLNEFGALTGIHAMATQVEVNIFRPELTVTRQATTDDQSDKPVYTVTPTEIAVWNFLRLGLLTRTTSNPRAVMPTPLGAAFMNACAGRSSRSDTS